MSHADYTGVRRETPMEKALFACDELAGFITAVALVKPGKSLAEVDAKSVRKKMKDKAFARSVCRDDIMGSGIEYCRFRSIVMTPSAPRSSNSWLYFWKSSGSW